MAWTLIYSYKNALSTFKSLEMPGFIKDSPPADTNFSCSLMEAIFETTIGNVKEESAGREKIQKAEDKLKFLDDKTYPKPPQGGRILPIIMFALQCRNYFIEIPVIHSELI